MMIKRILLLLTLSFLAVPVYAQDIPGNLTNPGDTKVVADNDDSGNGEVQLQRGSQIKLVLKNSGKLQIFDKASINAVATEPDAWLDFGVIENDNVLKIRNSNGLFSFNIVKGEYFNNADPIPNPVIRIGHNTANNLQENATEASHDLAFEGDWIPSPGVRTFETYLSVKTYPAGDIFRPWGWQINKSSGYTSHTIAADEISIAGLHGKNFSVSLTDGNINMASGNINLSGNLSVASPGVNPFFKVTPTRLYLGPNTVQYFEVIGEGLYWRDANHNRSIHSATFLTLGSVGSNQPMSALYPNSLSLGAAGSINWSSTSAISPQGATRLAQLSPGVLAILPWSDPVYRGTLDAKIKAQELQVFFPGIGYRTVVVGAPDSGGQGFRELKIAN